MTEEQKKEKTIFYKNLTGNIKRLLKKHSYSYQDIAEIVGTPYGSFTNKIRNNDSYLSIIEIQKIASEFFLSIDDLIKGNF